MTHNYDSAARSLALPLSPLASPVQHHPPTRTTRWTRSRTQSSGSLRPAIQSSGVTGLRDQLIDAARKLNRQVKQTVKKMSILQRAIVGLGLLVGFVLTLLFFVYNERILHWLQPYAAAWHERTGGWILLWVVTFVTAFPPAIGYSTSVAMAGFIYGFPQGWFIVATANVIGSLCSFIASRTILSGFVQRRIANDKRFAALSLVLKHDGLKLLIMIRLCPLPYSLSNGAMASIPTVKPFAFALATAIASPKLLIHVFVGSRFSAIGREDKMDTTVKAINYISIALGILFGFVTGWLIYQRTAARARQLEAEERSKLEQRGQGLSHPDEFVDGLDGDHDNHALIEDIDFLDHEAEQPYSDDVDEE